MWSSKLYSQALNTALDFLRFCGEKQKKACFVAGFTHFLK